MDAKKKYARIGLRFFQSAYHHIHDEEGTQKNGRRISLMRSCGRVVFRLFGGRSYGNRSDGHAGFIASRHNGNQVVEERRAILSHSTQDSNTLVPSVGKSGNVVDLGYASSTGSADLCKRIHPWYCRWLHRAHCHGFINADGCAGSESFSQKFFAHDQVREPSSGRGRGGHHGRFRNIFACIGISFTLVLLSILPAKLAYADVACPSYNIFSKLLTDICWDCMFPITIAGAQMNSGSSTKPPGAAATTSTCSCPSKGSPIPSVGFPFSMWAPARLVEVVRRPYCFPLFGGKVMSGKSAGTGAAGRMMGGPGPGATDYDNSDSVFYHYHYFAFPLAILLNLFSGCAADGLVGFDLMYLSELDPTWNDSQLAFFLSPETVLVANPVAQAACVGDAAASNVGHPLDSMFWCAGSWGGLYPFTGTVTTNGDPVANSSLIVARALAALHRRGLAWKTMGSTAMCGAYIYPTIPKTQYKLEQLYPLAEANGNHWIGESPFKWGEWRNVPGVGEDFVHMIWRWQDCCVPFL